MSQSNNGDSDDHNRRAGGPQDAATKRMTRSLPGPPMPPHGYRHHPHGPPTHPHQHMIFMPMPPPGGMRDGVPQGGMPVSQQHIGNRPHGPGHPPHPQPHPYYANHRGPRHPFMMTMPMQHHHQPPHHPHNRPHPMSMPLNKSNPPSMVNGKPVKNGYNKPGNQAPTTMGKTRQPYVKKASGVKWTTEEVSLFLKV